MKKVNYLLGMLFTGTTLLGQPCSTFENPNPMGNWVGINTLTNTSTNPLDGSQCASIRDQSGSSIFRNGVDYADLGNKYKGRCLCFDYKVVNDGFAASSPAIAPTIYLSTGAGTLFFSSNQVITEASNWISVCIPIEYCSGGVLPSNSEGQWQMYGTMDCNLFNTIMADPDFVFFSADVAGSALQTEIVQIDNVCVKQCPPCNSDFTLQTNINTATGVADARVLLPPINSTYKVYWGDGTFTGPNPPNTSINATHSYSTPGSYGVCVFQYDRSGREICRTCMRFCYERSTQSPGRVPVGTPLSKSGGEPAGQDQSGIEILNLLNDPKFEMSEFTIFPNPSGTYAEIQMTILEKESVSIRILDISGKVVAQITNKNYEAGEQSIKIETQNLAAGIYIVELNRNGNISSQKLSVAR